MTKWDYFLCLIVVIGLFTPLYGYVFMNPTKRWKKVLCGIFGLTLITLCVWLSITI